MEESNIPVLIDSHKNSEKVRMTRCNYFSIESDSPAPNWILSISNNEIPFFLIGLSGIIIKPLTAATFNDANSINSLFEVIEENPSLYVDINEIWLPNTVFNRKPERGDVFRLPNKLFTLSIRFQNKQILLPEYLNMSEEFTDRISFSEIETNAFKLWEQNLIGQTIEIYHRNPELALKWIDTNNNTDTYMTT